MRISGTSQTTANQGVGAVNWPQRQQGFKNLMTALQAGDLNGAKAAYSSLTNGAQTIAGNSPMAQLGHALQSGDLARAQQVAKQMQANTNLKTTATTGNALGNASSGGNTGSSDSGSGLLSAAAAVATGGATAIRGSLVNLLA